MATLFGATRWNTAHRLVDTGLYVLPATLTVNVRRRAPTNYW
jgi:hypothetical protein